MPNTLPPVPYKSPIVDRNGFLTAAWSGFFLQLFKRAGGLIAPTNEELGNSTSGISGSVGSIESSVSTLDSRTTALESQVQGLGVGRAL